MNIEQIKKNCPKKCDSISYLHDDQEHKTCIRCRCVWDRFTNEEQLNKEK